MRAIKCRILDLTMCPIKRDTCHWFYHRWRFGAWRSGGFRSTKLSILHES
jgi:hypothetical protein